MNNFNMRLAAPNAVNPVCILVRTIKNE